MLDVPESVYDTIADTQEVRYVYVLMSDCVKTYQRTELLWILVEMTCLFYSIKEYNINLGVNSFSKYDTSSVAK